MYNLVTVSVTVKYENDMDDGVTQSDVEDQVLDALEIAMQHRGLDLKQAAVHVKINPC